MEATELIIQLFTYLFDLVNQFASFVFGNWVMALFFAGSIILMVLNLVLISSGSDE